MKLLRKLIGRLNQYFSSAYNWYGSNMQKLIFIVFLHLVFSYLLGLPYINIIASLFDFLPFLLDWIAILILFKPRKEFILRMALILFAGSYFLAIIKLNFIFVRVGEIVYLMIATYILFSLRDLKKAA